MLHFSHLRNLVLQEQKAQVDEYKALIAHQSHSQLQRKGLAILNLQILESRVGLGGRLFVKLGRTLPFPAANLLRVGDVVSITACDEDEVTGVITAMSAAKLEVSLDESLDADMVYRLIKMPNEVSFRRMLKALESHDHPLVAESFAKETERSYPKLLSLPRLNESQNSAVAAGLEEAPFTLIHGPPGTGKTETLVHLIRELIKLEKRVLVTGPSNLSVDNLVERLAPYSIPMVRVGHPARVTEAASLFSLDYLVSQSDGYAINKDIRREMDSLIRAKGKESREERRQRWATVKDLRKDLRVRESRTVDEVLRNAKIVLTTLSMSGSSLLEEHQFDIVLIDEASQALEPECWIALIKGKRAILAGDHCQLPPTVTCAEAVGLEKTLFERLVDLQPACLLRTQYRMNELIMNWSSAEFYQGKLEAHDTVRHHCLEGFPPFLLIDTDGFDLDEEEDENGSKRNLGEAKIVREHVQKLLSAEVNVSVITPYSAQVELLKGLLPNNVEVSTVDGFQGRENDAIIISLVRSNDQGEIGFLSEHRRTNVAITRARKHLCIVGNGSTLSRDHFYKRLWSYAERHGQVDVPDVYL